MDDEIKDIIGSLNFLKDHLKMTTVFQKNLENNERQNALVPFPRW
jgi:hypothetical protein